MPKGSPTPQTIASEKYQKKAGVSQAAKITELMLAFAEEQERE